MNEINRHYIWALTGPLLLLYAVAVAIFYAVEAAVLRLTANITDGYKSREPRIVLGVLLAALGANFIAAAALAQLARLAGIPSRQSLILFPLALLAERRIRLGWKTPNSRYAHAYGFLGAAAGLLAGAWMFLASDAAQGTVASVVVPGDVPTLPLSEIMRNPSDWAISIQLVVFYCVSMAIFFGAHGLLKRFARKTGSKAAEERPRTTQILSALALNFCGVALLVLLGRAADVQIRLAMVFLPLLCVLEAYVKLIRADMPNRKAYFAGIAGTTAGMVSAALLLLRGAPVQ